MDPANGDEALQEVAPQNIDDSELPLLIAPIPADQNGGITSHFYEQLLPQLRRQRATVRDRNRDTESQTGRQVDR